MGAGSTDVVETETTAHTISATLALLALHPEEQEKAVEEIRDVLSDGREPVLNARIRFLAHALTTIPRYSTIFLR